MTPELQPGPELDAATCEKVLGWEWREYQAWDGPQQLLWHPSQGEPRGDDFNHLADGRWVSWYQPAVSTSIGAAWQVVEAMEARGYHFWFQASPGEVRHAVFRKRGELAAEADGDTAPEAICRAALAALKPEGASNESQ